MSDQPELPEDFVKAVENVAFRITTQGKAVFCIDQQWVDTIIMKALAGPVSELVAERDMLREALTSIAAYDCPCSCDRIARIALDAARKAKA